MSVAQQHYHIECPLCSQKRPIINDEPEIVTTSCGHIFCEVCIMHLITKSRGQKANCPICMTFIGVKDVRKLFISGLSARKVECPICLDQKDVYESEFCDLTATQCGHLFCQSCLQQHHECTIGITSTMCPVCKSATDPSTEHKVFLFGIVVSEADDSCSCSTASVKPKWYRLTNSNEPPPAAALIGGHDCDGQPLYVARVHHAGDLLPGKVNMQYRHFYGAYDGREIEFPLRNCEILTGNDFKWVGSSDGQIPSYAVKAGWTSSREHLFPARVQHKGSLQLGKLHPSHGCAYIPFDGKEICFKNYEVLVQEPK